MSGNSEKSGGIGFFGLLGIAFIVLKLTHTITWSWLWVLSPLWAPLAIIAAVLLLYALLVGAAKVVEWWEA